MTHLCDTWGNWATCGRASESALNFVIYNFCIKLLSWDWHQSYLLLLMSLVVDWECNHPLKNPHAEWAWICYWTSEIDCLTDHCILSFQLRRGTQQELGWKSNSFCILLEEVTFSFNSHLSLTTTLGGRVYHYSHFTDKENRLGRLLGHIVNKWSINGRTRPWTLSVWPVLLPYSLERITSEPLSVFKMVEQYMQ